MFGPLQFSLILEGAEDEQILLVDEARGQINDCMNFKLLYTLGRGIRHCFVRKYQHDRFRSVPHPCLHSVIPIG